MPEMTDMETAKHGLSDHICQAIVQNKARRRDYHRLGGMPAHILMTKLIWVEAAILPFARRLDRRAQVFRDQGIAILQAELSPISSSPDVATPFAEIQKLQQRDLRDLRSWASDLRQTSKTMLLAQDFSGISSHAGNLVAKVREREQATAVRFALFLHLVESMGHFAACGADFARQSHGATASLTAAAIKGHMRALEAALTMDKWANPMQRKGLGILINDLPPIPSDT